MVVLSGAPTYREPVIYHEGLKKWTFDPHWLDWFLRQTAISATVVTDHGALTGLADDDHPQYHNDARGDLRYQPLDADLTAIAALTTTAFGRALLALVGSPDMTSTAFGGLPSGTAFPVPQEVVVKQAGSWVRLAWADFLTAVSGVSSASLDFSQASNSQYIGAVYI